MDSFTVTKTHPDLVKYAVSLQKKNSSELGFLPKMAFEQKYSAGRMIMGMVNNHCRLHLGAGKDKVLRIHQACIQYDARRCTWGSEIVKATEQHARDTGCQMIVLRCREGLEANAFWEAEGYIHVNTVEGGKQRGKPINVWCKTATGLWMPEPAIAPQRARSVAVHSIYIYTI